jgi:signal transduction histidine kinase
VETLPEELRRELSERTRQIEELRRSFDLRVQQEVERRARAQVLLAQQSRLAAMGEVLAAIAHQWRQPLNVLALVVQNLKDADAHGQLNSAYLDTSVQRAMRQIQQMSRTIDEFRRFFQPDESRTEFDAMEAVASVLSLVSAQLSSNGIEVRLTCHTHGRSFARGQEVASCGEKTIRGPRHEFEHVVLSLVDGARVAILERRRVGGVALAAAGRIEFEFRHDAGRALVTVRDNGGAIDEATLARLLEPHATPEGPGRGRGLGLYLARVIVEEHLGGELHACNQDDGVAFTITLPPAAEGEGRG